MKQYIKNKYFLALLFILFVVFWIWWLPGPKVANDFSFISQDWLRLQFDVPRAWNERGAEGLGEYGVFTLWSYPVNFISGIFANFGLTFEIWERALVVLFIFVGSISIWKFLGNYGLSDKARFIGALFYLINTYPILLLDGGQISIACAYGLFPYVFLFLSQSVDANIKKKIAAGLLVTALGYLDIRFIYMILLIFLIKVPFDILCNRKRGIITSLGNWIWFGVIAGIIVLGLNAYWLVAQLKTPLDVNIFSSFTRISTDFVNIGHAFFVISPHWYRNVFGQVSNLRYEFILLPVLVFLAPMLRKKDKNVLFWLLTAIIAIFLTKGGGDPLPGVYHWLHLNIPGFSLFRDSTKFFFLTTLSYSVLIAISVEEIMRRIYSKKIKILLLSFFVAYLLFLIRPVFFNQMTGTFSFPLYEKEFRSLAAILQKDNLFGRIVWIPATAPLTYSDSSHPIIEAARIFNRVPFVWGVKGGYETFNFLREAPYMGELFDVAGIAYIAYPELDFRRETNFSENIKYYYVFLNQLSRLSWIEKDDSESKVPLLKTKTHQDKIFITDNTWIVFGTDDVLKKTTNDAKLRLSNNAIIFAEYKNELGSLISQWPEAKIVLNNKTEDDLLATFFPRSEMLFPAKQLNTKPNGTGWWKNDGGNLIGWRDFLQSKYKLDSKEFDYGGGWTVGEGGLQLKIQDPGIKKERYLFARVMESSRSGNLKFYQDENEIGEIKTIAQGDANVRWFKIGQLVADGKLTIVSNGDINVINALTFIDAQNLDIYKNKTESLNKQVAIFTPENVTTNSSSVSYKKLDQTRYQISVSNLSHPEMVVFSESFHPLWVINDQEAVPVYGFLNGFRIEKNGTYLIKFKPQDDIDTGIIVSLVSLGLIMGIFLFRVIRGNS